MDEIEELIQSAEQGDSAAQNYLAIKLAHSGKEKSLEGALYWYLEAVRKGYVDAMWNAGSMLMDGEGGIQDRQLGLRLIEIAAKSGKTSARRYLAYCYEKGLEGFEKNPSLASQWNQRVGHPEDVPDFAEPVDVDAYLADQPTKPNSYELLRQQ